jgi:SAM-dependent methyltransferase
VPDALFDDPRLVQLYDPLEADRTDLFEYLGLVDKLGAHTILDVGCGTGTFACLLASRGKSVVGVDPADASLEVARRKPGADRVRWVRGDASSLPRVKADLVIMTGNVAQVFIEDREWEEMLRSVRSGLIPGGAFVFEVRDPAREAWREWTREESFRRTEVDGVGAVQSWVDLIEVRLPLVSFRLTYCFEVDDSCITSDSTLRFRSRTEIEASLAAAGFAVNDVRDAPDRPGRELVFIASV